MEGTSLFIIIMAAMSAYIIYQFHDRQKVLRRIEKMLEDAKNGCFHPERIDESVISSVENSMKQFLQAGLIHKEQLQEQKNQIQTLISDISHQTVTPLSNILIYSQLLEEELADNLSGEKAQAIRKQAEKLDFLLETLVKTSRLENGIISIVPQCCNLANLIKSVLIQTARKTEEKEINLRFEPMETPVYAVCDPKWTKEACFNILDNAVKYTKRGGQVDVVITEYQMFARIDIRDNGIGISEYEIPKLYSRFYRGLQVSNEEGVGLGLCLARKIIESEGGYMKVASEEGTGSCFSVFLPKEK